MSVKRRFFAALAGLLLMGPAQGESLSSKEERYLRRHAKAICAHPCGEGLDWSALGARIRGKRIVALGEFNHGSREIAERRNALIRALHEKGIVGALLFESGIGELAAIDDQMALLDPAVELPRF